MKKLNNAKISILGFDKFQRLSNERAEEGPFLSIPIHYPNGEIKDHVNISLFEQRYNPFLYLLLGYIEALDILYERVEKRENEKENKS